MFISNTLSIVLIIIILYTYYYLVELSNCPCFIANKKDEVQLNYMKFYLMLDLFSILIAMFLFRNIQSKGGKLQNEIENVLLIASILIVVLIHGYMTYNVYYFYNSVKSYCNCVQQWQKYFVYYEGIVSGLVTLQYVISFIFIILFLLFSNQ